MKRIFNVVVLLAILLTISMPMAQTTKAQQDECFSIVYDGARLFGNRYNEVLSAANNLVKLGADVHVMTIETIGNAGNLDDYEVAFRQRCKLNDEKGLRKSNLIILMFAQKELLSGIYNGETWDRIGPTWRTQVRADVMNPPLRTRDYASSFVNTLNEITTRADKVIHPQTAVPVAPPPVVIVIPTSVVKVPDTPSGPPPDYSWVGNVFLVLIGLGVIVGIGYLAIVYGGKNQKAQEQKSVARQDATAARNSAASRINAFNEEK